MVSMNAATSVATLRQAVREEVASSSLRNVSRQAGMSASGLQKFLEGGKPFTATRRRLERWYVLHGPGRLETGLTAPAAMAVLRDLVQDLSPPRHRPVMALAVRHIEDAYAAARLAEPEWLEQVRGELGARAA
jgi:hypothetical protein